MANPCRILKMLFVKSGSGSVYPKIGLPKAWLEDMGVTEENREVAISFVDGKIIIEKA